MQQQQTGEGQVCIRNGSAAADLTEVSCMCVTVIKARSEHRGSPGQSCWRCEQAAYSLVSMCMLGMMHVS